MVKHRRGDLRAKETLRKPMRLARDGFGLKNHWRLITNHEVSLGKFHKFEKSMF